MLECPVCSHANAAGAKFCSDCGAALTAEPPREERKVVTVLFADLVGFTSRAEQLDPEDVRAVLAPYWERLRGELEKRGGTVEKFIGDAVMALFGAPVAHDDDPLRAVGAALAIRDWARDEGDVQVRIAVNTGEALVLLGARPGEGEGMAAGDVVNTTARLQAAAPVNGVLVGETTYRATRDVIEYREHDAVVAKGKSAAIPVWEAVQVRSRLGVDVESRPLLPMVGRTRELGVIVDAFERAKAQREPQLVTLVGVPGIGKSRLVGEFFGRLEDDPDLVWWRQGRALPYGEGISFWALAEMVKAQAGIDENDAPEVAAAKLSSSVDALVDDEERNWVFQHLSPLVGGESRAGRGEGHPAWRRYFEGMAEQRPLVMVFEDMHWADEALLDFIDHLVDWAADVPLLVVATARPELLDRRPGWAGGKLNASTVALTPLRDDEAAAVIHAVLDEAVLPADTQQALIERAGGNPLYAEQFALLYRERGTAENLPMPETVQGLIAARLDGLQQEEKRVVQDAAVHGKVFWAGAVAAEPEILHGLERKGLLRRERRSSVGGETQYAFRHVLVRDVAYGQIPRAARGEKHLRAAEWIEELGRAEDHAELLAHHLLAAHDLGAVDTARVRVALRLAGERAFALGAFPSAERYYAQALALWPDDDDDRLPVVSSHARARFRAADDVEVAGAAVDVLEAAGRRDEAASLAALASSALWFAGRHDEATASLDRGTGLLEGLAPSPALAELLTERARQRIFREEYEGASADSALALELTERFDMVELRAGLTVTNGVIAMVGGDVDAARATFERAVEIAPPASQPLFRALANLCVIEHTAGDQAAWELRHAAAKEAMTRAGDRLNLRWLEANSVGEALYMGRWDEALRRAEALRATGRHYSDRGSHLIAAEILAARGQLAEARSLRDEAVERASSAVDGQAIIPALMNGAWVSLLLDEPDRAAQLFDDAVPFAMATRHRAPAVSVSGPLTAAALGRAETMLERHRRNTPITRNRASLALLEGRVLEAAELWAEISPYDEAWARIHAGRALIAQGRRSDGEAQLVRGLAFFRAVGATKVVRDAEALLAAAAAAE
jgi:class 3 adenylate cyclase/tetratricopeptide (TPR) repeat protein